MTQPKLHLVIAVVLCIFAITISQGRTYAQGDTYANYVKDSTSDFRGAHRLGDNDRTNYAYISTAIGVLTTSAVRVGFPISGEAGDVVSVTVQGTGQVLGVNLLNGITVRLYDSLGALVATGNGGSLLKLALLSGADNIYSIRFLTNPTASYRFKEARIEFNNVLSVNLLNELRVYDVAYQQHCPETMATGAVQAGAGTSPSLLQGYVTNAGNVTDANPDNYATLTVPLNLLNLLPPAYLDVAFTKPVKAGEYVGFTVSQASALLGVALLQNIEIAAYDPGGAVVVARSGNLLNLKLLAGTSSRYMLGFVTPSGSYTISRLRITLKGVLNLLQDVNVYNAFHYRPVKPPVTVIASGSTNICTEGSVTLTAIDSIGGGTFRWSTGATTASITVSQPGTYTVQITDETGCSRNSVPVVITTLPDVQLTATVTNTKCNNTGDGAISVTNASAGSYTYRWSNGQMGQSISGLIPGVYALTITNTANSCVYNRTFSVVSDNNLTIKTAVVNTSDKQKSDGRIMVSVDGGSGNYQYSWSNGASTAELMNIAAGIYYLTVTDITAGCSLSDTIIVNDGNGGLTLTPEVTNTSSCNQASGRATVRVTGGSGNYSYLWSTGATTASIEGLSAGNYYLLVTDNQTGQKRGIMVVIGNTGQPEVTATITPTNCNGAAGSIQLAVTGGSGTYTYQWHTGIATASLAGVGAGVYIVTVTDATTGCIVNKVFTVTAQSGPTATFTVTRPDPFRDIPGSVMVTASGNYSYLWSNGSTVKDQANLLPGMYTLTIRDNVTGCSSTYMFDLSAGATLYINATPQANTECENAYNGGVTLDVSGGVPPYKYSWSNGGSTQNLANVGPGDYTVTVTDAIGSTNAVTVRIISADVVNTLDCNSRGGDGSDIVIHNVVTPNGDGTNDIWRIDGINRFPNNNIMVFDKWGDMVFEQKGYDNSWDGTDKNNNPLPAGTYYYLLKLNPAGSTNIKSEYTGFITVKR